MKENVCEPIFKAKKKSGLAKSTTNVKLKKNVFDLPCWSYRSLSVSIRIILEFQLFGFKRYC